MAPMAFSRSSTLLSALNFLIAAMCTATYAFTPTRPATRSKIGLFAVAMVAAYLTTLVANTVRILIGIQVHLHSISFARLSTEQIHRVEGVAVYFLFLCTMYFGGHAMLTYAVRRADGPVLVTIDTFRIVGALLTAGNSRALA